MSDEALIWTRWLRLAVLAVLIVSALIQKLWIILVGFAVLFVLTIVQLHQLCRSKNKERPTK